MRLLAARCAVVVTAGGLGPTMDDVTVAGITKSIDAALTRHPELEHRLRDFYGARLTDAHLRMAQVRTKTKTKTIKRFRV